MTRKAARILFATGLGGTFRLRRFGSCAGTAARGKGSPRTAAASGGTEPVSQAKPRERRFQRGLIAIGAALAVVCAPWERGWRRAGSARQGRAPSPRNPIRPGDSILLVAISRDHDHPGFVVAIVIVFTL